VGRNRRARRSSVATQQPGAPGGRALPAPIGKRGYLKKAA
jgi:hypothetical protein